MNYKFDNLLKIALKDWPVDIDLSEIHYSKNDPSKYTVKGLGIMSDLISEKYIGSPDEVIFRNLHQSIYAVLHAAAPNVWAIKISNIRHASVRNRFEKHLKIGVENSEIGYSREDILLCSKYFHENSD
ncbi:MAG: hypothetical protein RSB86_15465 [Comamonas sp.]|uniref:hypothetical protein n=1 Tax=Comamonas sp. TaxID=34028 RepID=UPI002FC93ACD